VSEQGIPLGGSKRGCLSFPRDFIVSASRTLLGGGLVFRLPFGLDKFVSLEPAKGRVDGPAGEPGCLHDIEAIAIAKADCFEDESGGMGQSRWIHDYVVCYHK
jgi:hypothetical protein